MATVIILAFFWLIFVGALGFIFFAWRDLQRQNKKVQQAMQAVEKAMCDVDRAMNNVEARAREVVRRYATDPLLGEKHVAHIRQDLLAIAGTPHIHRSRDGNSDMCFCGRDLRHEVHHRASEAA